MPKPDLDNAYALDGVEDARRLYADWAETYDTSFVQALDFTAHLDVARAFAGAGGTGPVLDFGCGSGVLGEALVARGCRPVDGADLSPEMLDVARRKAVYRDLIAGDVLAGLDIADGTYAGVVSSGTFTHGHVGPDALGELLRIARPGAQFALMINAKFYDAAEFAGVFENLSDRIGGLSLPEVGIYGPGAAGPHKDDMARIALFTKR